MGKDCGLFWRFEKFMERFVAGSNFCMGVAQGFVEALILVEIVAVKFINPEHDRFLASRIQRRKGFENRTGNLLIENSRLSLQLFIGLDLVIDFMRPVKIGEQKDFLLRRSQGFPVDHLPVIGVVHRWSQGVLGDYVRA